MQAILPGLSPDELAEILLAAVAAPPVALRIDPDAAEGLLGPGPEASTVVAAAEPVPPAILAQNEEFQAAAKKVKQRQSLVSSEASRPKHWRGPPVNRAWNREDLLLHLPSEHYKPAQGLQNTWEVSFRGEHVAKRSFLKYGSAAMAAKHVLWEAWGHHFRRTGERCPIPWLLKIFTSEADLQDEAALDAATLGSLAATAAVPKRARAKKKPVEPFVTAAEPGHLAAEPGHLAAASSSSAAEPSGCKVSLATCSLAKPPADTATRQKRSAATAKKLPREPKRSKTSKKVVSKASSSSSSGSSSTSSSSSSDCSS